MASNISGGLICAFFLLVGAGIAINNLEKGERDALSAMKGECFDTEAGPVGRMVYALDSTSVLLAFTSGSVAQYPFDTLTKVNCSNDSKNTSKSSTIGPAS